MDLIFRDIFGGKEARTAMERGMRMEQVELAVTLLPVRCHVIMTYSAAIICEIHMAP
jgi:hypothetical protein